MLSWAKADDNSDAAFNHYKTALSLLFAILVISIIMNVVSMYFCCSVGKCNLLYKALFLCLILVQGAILGIVGMSYRQVTMYGNSRVEKYQVINMLHCMVLNMCLYAFFIFLYGCCMKNNS